MLDMVFERKFRIKKPIIGMIHLAGDSSEDRVRRALKELEIYENNGVSGAIIENYHGSLLDVLNTFNDINKKRFNILTGLNLLGHSHRNFELGEKYHVDFAQFDNIQRHDLDMEYDEKRETSGLYVFGGVRFKYIPPTGNSLEIDLEEAKKRCDVIVTTGSGTGVETPIEKLREFKRLLGDFPLTVGAEVNIENVYEQLSVADGAIVGSYFKPNSNTEFPVDRIKVRDFMDIVREVRQGL